MKWRRGGESRGEEGQTGTNINLEGRGVRSIRRQEMKIKEKKRDREIRERKTERGRK